MSAFISEVNALLSEGWECVPADAVAEVKPDSVLVRRAWKLRNGATHVVLVNNSEATWEAYCAECILRSKGGKQ